MRQLSSGFVPFLQDALETSSSSRRWGFIIFVAIAKVKS
jgi:hypothetical protein